MAKNQIRIFFKKKKITKSSEKRAFVRVLRFRGKKLQGLYALSLSVLLTTLDLGLKSNLHKKLIGILTFE